MGGAKAKFKYLTGYGSRASPLAISCLVLPNARVTSQAPVLLFLMIFLIDLLQGLPGDRATVPCTLLPIFLMITHPLDLVTFWGSLREEPKASSPCNLFLFPLQPLQEARKFFVITFLGSIIWIAMFSYLMVWWAHQVSGQ